MNIDSFVTLLSLFLTPIVILASGSVVFLLFQSFKKSYKTEKRTPVEWMIIGIVISFTGDIFDNLWWYFAWSYNFLDSTSPERNFFFDYGVYSNTIFRQIFGIVGALCHVYAGSIQANVWHRWILYIGSVLGIIQVTYLILISSN